MVVPAGSLKASIQVVTEKKQLFPSNLAEKILWSPPFEDPTSKENATIIPILPTTFEFPDTILSEVQAATDSALSRPVQMRTLNIPGLLPNTNDQPITREPIISLYYPRSGCHNIIDAMVKLLAHEQDSDVVVLDSIELALGEFGILGKEAAQAINTIYTIPSSSENDVEKDESVQEKTQGHTARQVFNDIVNIRRDSTAPQGDTNLIESSLKSRIIYMRDFGSIARSARPLLPYLVQALHIHRTAKFDEDLHDCEALIQPAVLILGFAETPKSTSRDDDGYPLCSMMSRSSRGADDNFGIPREFTEDEEALKRIRPSLNSTLFTLKKESLSPISAAFFLSSLTDPEALDTNHLESKSDFTPVTNLTSLAVNLSVSLKDNHINEFRKVEERMSCRRRQDVLNAWMVACLGGKGGAVCENSLDSIQPTALEGEECITTPPGTVVVPDMLSKRTDSDLLDLLDQVATTALGLTPSQTSGSAAGRQVTSTIISQAYRFFIKNWLKTVKENEEGSKELKRYEEQNERDTRDLQIALNRFRDAKTQGTKIAGDDLQLLEFASELYKQFTQSGNMNDLDSLIALFRERIAKLPTSSDFYVAGIKNRVSALLTRFKEEGQETDLDEAISLCREVLELRLPSHLHRSSFLNSLAYALWTRFQQGGQRTDLDEVICLHREALELLRLSHLDQCISLNNLAAALSARFKCEGQQNDLDEAISLHREALELRPAPHPDRSMCLNNLALALSTQFEQGGQQIDINEAISLYREALELRPPFHPRRCSSLNNLGSALWTQFRQGGQRIDLDEAISLYREALELQPLPHLELHMSLNNLATALLTQFKQGGQKIDLDEAISLHREALELRPPDPDRSMSLNNLGDALLTQFMQGGQQIDLDEAISLCREALELRPLPHPHRCNSLNSLANALSTQFEQGQRIDLDEAVSLHREALELRPPPHPDRSVSLDNLAHVLLTQFEKGGQQIDLDEVISLHREALMLRPAPHPDRPNSLNSLANALRTHFEQGGQQIDLDEAISLHREGLELRPPPHPDRSVSLGNLAYVLWIQFQQGGQKTDLDEAISMHREALMLRPATQPNRSSFLNNLANALRTQFEQGGQQIDLDEAITLRREVLELQPPPHPHRSSSLNNLANILSIRFKQVGQQIDLDEAIRLHREALELLPPLHPHQTASFNNLASGLLTRFQRGGQQTDLNEAISLYREALELRPPPHPDRSSFFNNLAHALLHRFQQGGQQIDLNEAISLHREALMLRPAPHPDRYGSLHNLAGALSRQFQQGGQQIDLDEAISLYREVLELLPPLHPDRSVSLHALGELFMVAHPQTATHSEYLEQAMSSFLAATQCLSPSASHRLHVAKSWIRHAESHQHVSAIDAYEAALQVLPHVAALSFDIQSRQEALTANSDGLARDASRCAIRAGNLHKAIEFLEAGRSIFWSQVLSLRSPLDQLHNIVPGLADKLRTIGTALELGSHRKTSFEVSDNQERLSVDQEVSRMNRLNEEWVNAIDEVRQLDGFEDFLRPPRLSSLKPAACKNPVVILVANNDSSHCLIMTSTSTHHIPFSSLDFAMLRVLVYLVQIAASTLSISRSSIEQTREKIVELLGGERAMRYRDKRLGSSDDIFRLVLGMLWDEVVKPVINVLDIKKSGEMPMLQWCPTGLFTFLPVHAAGRYDDKLAIECASDYFISSYTPTIGVLLAHPPVPSTHTFNMMVVIQSIELPSAKVELENIQRHVPKDTLVKLGVPGVPAEVEVVASRLTDASIVHFACHGKQDRLKPLNSGLKLDDGLLKISRIMKETIPNGSLAFLCACETAMGDQKLPDEAMSLGASLLFSGFRRVVATMWEMMDQDGPTIADAFYEELFRGPDGNPVLEPDTTKSAKALHVAVKKLRSLNVSFRRWVPFIHMGK